MAADAPDTDRKPTLSDSDIATRIRRGGPASGAHPGTDADTDTHATAPSDADSDAAPAPSPGAQTAAHDPASDRDPH